MSIKDTLLHAASQARDYGRDWRRRLDQRVQMVEKRLDALNRRLANQSVPEERRSSVGRLVLEKKATAAHRPKQKPRRQSKQRN